MKKLKSSLTAAAFAFSGLVMYFIQIPLLSTKLIAFGLWAIALWVIVKPFMHVVITIVEMPFDMILFVVGYFKSAMVGGLSTLAPKPEPARKKGIGELLRERGVPSVDKTEERLGTTTIISSADLGNDDNDDTDAFIHYGNQRKGG